jgi:hypothetical protein
MTKYRTSYDISLIFRVYNRSGSTYLVFRSECTSLLKPRHITEIVPFMPCCMPPRPLAAVQILEIERP